MGIDRTPQIVDEWPGGYIAAFRVTAEEANDGQAFSRFRVTVDPGDSGRVVDAWSSDFDGALDVRTDGREGVARISNLTQKRSPGVGADGGFTVEYRVVGAEAADAGEVRVSVNGGEARTVVVDAEPTARSAVAFALDPETGAQWTDRDGAPLLHVRNDSENTETFSFAGRSEGSFEAPPGTSLVAVPGVAEIGSTEFLDENGETIGRGTLSLRQTVRHPDFETDRESARGSDFDGDGSADLMWSRDDIKAHYIGDSGDPNDKTFAGWHDNQKFLATGDFDGDGRTDAAWMYEASGGVAIDAGGDNNARSFQGYAPKPGSASVASADEGLLGVGDLDGDGADDMIWQWASGGVFVAKNGDLRDREWMGKKAGHDLEAVADFDGDGVEEILWNRGDAREGHYVQDGGEKTFAGYHSGERLVGVGDLDGDGTREAVWQYDGSGGVYAANPTDPSSKQFLGYAKGQEALAVGDFDGDGRDDVAWRYETGGTYHANGGDLNDRTWQGRHEGEKLVAVGDFVGGDEDDFVWMRQNGGTYIADGADHASRSWAGDKSGQTAVGAQQDLLGTSVPSSGDVQDSWG